MDSTLKELIQKATINGFLSEANKKFILEKANEQGIPETEVNIYIEAFLKENSANDKTNEFNVNSIDFKNIDWIDKLSYLFGFGILLSGLFPWIESHASTSFGSYNASFSGGSGLGYSIPFGLGALYFGYNLKLKAYRKYYGIGVAFVSFLIGVSYETHISSSYGGFSASGDTNAGPGVVVMLVMGLLYASVNFIKIFKGFLIRNANQTNQTTSFSSQLLISLIEPFSTITVLVIWIFYSDISNSEKQMYLLLILSITIGAFIYRKKINIKNIFLVLLILVLLDTVLNCFNIYSRIGIDYDIANDLQMRFGQYYGGNGELEFYRTRNFSVLLDKSLLNIEEIILFIKNISVFVGLFIILYKLLEIIQKFIKVDLLSKAYKIFSQYHKKLVWLLLILISINISGFLYITLKNKSDFQNEIDRRENHPQVSYTDSPTPKVEEKKEITEVASKFSESEEKSLIAKYTGYEESDLVYYNFTDSEGNHYDFSEIPNDYKLVDENIQASKVYINKTFKITWKSLTPLTNGEYDYPYNKIVSIQLLE